MTTMKVGLRDLRTMNSALISAIEWERSLAEANEYIPVERKKCEKRIETFRRLRGKIFVKLNMKPEVDPFADAKVVSVDELRKLHASSEGGKAL